MASRIANSLSRHPVVSFYILAFAISWLGGVPQAALSRNLVPFRSPIFDLLFIGGPAFAAFIMTVALSGRIGLRDLFARLFRWRVGVVWYAVALFGNVAIFLIALGIDRLLGGTEDLDFSKLGSLFALFPFLLISFLFNVWEEIGWRGFALPRLQSRYNALVSSLIVGVLWGLWHLPLFFTEGNLMSTLPFAAWFVSIVALAVLYTWLYNSAKGSLLLVTLFHAAGNTIGAAVFIAAGGISAQGYMIVFAVQCVAAIVVLVVYGPARLSRQTAE